MGLHDGLLEAYYLAGCISHDSYDCACEATLRSTIIQRLIELDEGFGVWLAARVFHAYGPIAWWRTEEAQRSVFHDWAPYRELVQSKQRKRKDKEKRPHGT